MIYKLSIKTEKVQHWKENYETNQQIQTHRTNRSEISGQEIVEPDLKGTLIHNDQYRRRP